jgi:REP element-mobilizing transposase RayT
MKDHVWQLRSQRCYRILERAFCVAAARVDARVAHFSVQHNHIHLVVEARDRAGLARAMQAMTIRMAKALNNLMNRSGAVFADRYHSRPLRTPTEVRRALVYVLCNARKHLARYDYSFTGGWVDPHSSGAWLELAGPLTDRLGAAAPPAASP